MTSLQAAQALPGIYDTTTNPGRWRRALDGVCEAVGGQAVALLIRQPGVRTRDKQMLSSRYLDFVRTPAGMYYSLWLSRLQNGDWDYLSQQDPWHLIPDTDMVPEPEALDRRSDYAMLRRKVGAGRRLGVKLNNDRLWFDATSVAFPGGAGVVPNAAYAPMQFLSPHLTKAVEIGRSFAALRARYAAVLTALDHVNVGLAVALPDGEIIVKNSRMAQMLDAADAARLGRSNRLDLSNADLNAALSEAIAQAALTAKGEGTSAERCLILPKRSGSSALVLDVAPLTDEAGEVHTGLQGALLTLIDPDHLPHVDTRRFVRLYGLTKAEAEVCDLLLKGHSTEEIAEMRSTTPVTTKNQIGAILSKTGTTRRSDLIRLVMRVLPPVT